MEKITRYVIIRQCGSTSYFKASSGWSKNFNDAKIYSAQGVTSAVKWASRNCRGEQVFEYPVEVKLS